MDPMFFWSERELLDELDRLVCRCGHTEEPRRVGRVRRALASVRSRSAVVPKFLNPSYVESFQ